MKITSGVLYHDIDLSQFNSWRAGGHAERLYRPRDRHDLAEFLKALPASEPITFLGLGSNILFRDGLLRGTVILTQGSLNALTLCPDGSITAECGVACAQLARFGAKTSKSGSAFLAGIPGTVGGALKMNAGCFGSETWEWVSHATLVNRHGEFITLPKSAFDIAYRFTKAPEEHYFVEAQFSFPEGSKEKALAEIKHCLDRRASTQPTGEPTCGSVFRNPEGDYAGRLIEASGLKGASIGEAAVSEKHANFIINQGKATAADIEQLIKLIQDTVNKEHRIKLHPEVQIMGEHHA